MIVLLRPDVTAEQVRALHERIRQMGLQVVALDDAKGRAVEVLGDERGRALTLADDPGVQEILTRRLPLTGGEPLIPHFAMRLGIVAILVICAVLLLSAFAPPGLGDPASKPLAYRPAVEWYLRPPVALLEAFPTPLRWLGGTLVLLFGFALMLLPYVDRRDPSTPRGHLVSNAVRAAGALVILVSLVLIVLMGVRP